MRTYEKARARTRACIEDTFWKLYIENGLHHVTVQEVARLAGIHRATFYTYFESIDLVLASI